MIKYYETIADIIVFSSIIFKEKKEKQKDYLERAIDLCKAHEEKFNKQFDEDKFRNYVLERIENYENKHKD
jgi:hypothetical protein